MKRQYSLMLVVLLIVMLSACGKQAETESAADKDTEQYEETESVETISVQIICFVSLSHAA